MTVVECHTREALAIAPRASFCAHQVVEVIDLSWRARAYINGVEIDFYRSREPTDKVFIEVFNASFQIDCLN